MLLNDGFGGWITWGLVPNNRDRIEVVPGGSNLYGTWAMGGIVHLITQPTMAGPGFRAEGQAGNLHLNSYQQAVSAHYGTQRATREPEGETPRGDRWETKLFAQWQTCRNLTPRSRRPRRSG